MNYRHAFHAGNHADVVKHALMHLALDRLLQKPKPITVVDAFAGGGLVDLHLDDRAQRGGEWRQGAARLWPVSPEQAGDQPALTSWRAALARRNPDGALRFMPGSPLQLLDRLRPEDKLLAVEKHPEEAAALRRALAGDRRARVYEQDGWEALQSFLPPSPRRGLALIDPPFEEKGEYDRLAGALASALKRWSTGVIALWHPVKDRALAAAYEAALIRAADATPLMLFELLVKPAGDGLLGSGLAVANPPFGLEDAATALGPALAEALRASEAEPAAWRLEMLVARR